MAAGVSTKGNTYLGVSVALTLVATIAVILRFVARRIQSQKPGLDDWTILASLVLEYAMAVEAILWAVKGKIGFYTSDLTQAQLTWFFKVFFANQITYSCLCPTIKASILLFYRRLFPTRRFRQATLVVGVLVVSWGIAVVCVSIFQCSPVHGFWDFTVPHQCIEGQTFFWANAISNLLLDVIILCLPIKVVWSLQLTTAKKIGVLSIFLLGGFVCVASIMRIVSLGLIKNVDVIETLATAATWTTIEPCIGIVCACLPTFRALLVRYSHIFESRLVFSGSRKLNSERKPILADSSNSKSNDPNLDLEVSLGSHAS